MTFKLRFHSTIVLSAGPQSVTTTVLADEINLRASVVGDLEQLQVDGQGPIDHIELHWDRLPSNCTSTSAHGPSTCSAEIYWSASNRLRLNYSPGHPAAALTATCPGGSFTLPDLWVNLYQAFRGITHDPIGNNGYQYLRMGWSMTGQKNPWAVRAVSNTAPAYGGSAAEITVFTLTHVPE